ncbi:hypothetical protein DXU06_45025 [Bradyrhizobium elkanii]
MHQCSFVGRGWNMIALDHLRALASLVLQLEGRLEKVGVQPRCSIQTFKYARRLDTIEPTVSHESPDDRAVLLLDESLIILLVGASVSHRSFACDQGTTTSFMNALPLSKSAPRMPQGNRLCARSIARTTRPPSRVTSGMHSVQPVATSTLVNVCMNEPATDVPPCATMSTSQNPGGGSCQSLNVRTGTSRRTAE